MKYLVKFIRQALGYIIVLLDLVSRPKKLKRSSEAQAKVEADIANMSLYQFYACPFCIKTRRALHKLNLPIQTRNASEGSQHRQALLAGGGTIKVPCLRIEQDNEVKWMYESSDIIQYLNQRFS
jgi:glutaredoxin